MTETREKYKKKMDYRKKTIVLCYLKHCLEFVPRGFPAIFLLSCQFQLALHTNDKKKELRFFISFDLNTNAATLCWPQIVCATQYKKDEKKIEHFHPFGLDVCVCRVIVE